METEACCFAKGASLLGIIVSGLAVSAIPAGIQGAEQASLSIILPASDDVVLKFAAQDLSRYLSQMTGEPIDFGNAGAKHPIYMSTVPPSASALNARADARRGG